MEKETAKDPCAENRKLFAQAVREAFIRKFEAELADPVIDAQTGIECCCDGCDFLEACFPEQGEGKD